MDETKREIRVADDSAGEQSDETRSPEATTVPTVRLLANPRRVRRN